MNVNDLIKKYKLVKSDNVKYHNEDTYYVFNNHDYSITNGFVLRTCKNVFLLATDVYFIEKQDRHPNVSISYGPWDINSKIKDMEYHLKYLKRKYNMYLVRYKKEIVGNKLMEISKDFQ